MKNYTADEMAEVAIYCIRIAASHIDDNDKMLPKLLAVADNIAAEFGCDPRPFYSDFEPCNPKFDPLIQRIK